MNDDKYGSFAKETANNLDITTSTLRRWSLGLEKSGYKFEKNDKGQRIYFERDYKALREIKSLLKSGRGFDECVNAVVARVKSDEKTPSVHENPVDEVRLSKSELQEMLNEAALQAAEHVTKKLVNVVELRDHQVVQQLGQSFLESSAAKEKQKNKWWRFWK